MPIPTSGQMAGAAGTLSELATVLARIEQAGFPVAEIMPDRFWTLTGGIVNQHRLAMLQQTLERFSLRYTMHAPFTLNLFDHRHPGLQDQLFRSCIEVAAAIKAEVIVYHSGRREQWGTAGLELPELIEFEGEMLRVMGELAREHGIRIAVENMVPTTERKAGMGDLVPYGSNVRTLARQLKAVDHPNVGMCLDFGHAFLYEASTGGDIVKAIACAASFINHFHVHDNFGRPDGHPHYAAHPDLRAIGEADLHMPIGWGLIPFDEIFANTEFPRAPIAMSEVNIIDDLVLTETAASLTRLLELNHARSKELVAAS